MSFRSADYDVWKNGRKVRARQRVPTRFAPTQEHEPISPSRIVAVDTESFHTEAGRSASNPDGLRTLLVQVALPHPSEPDTWPRPGAKSHWESNVVVIETPDGKGMLKKLFDTLFSVPGFAVDASESDIRSRDRSERKRRATGKDGRRKTGSERSGKDGRKVALPPIVLAFYNLEYDIGRLFADQRFEVEGMVSGAGEFRRQIGRYTVEISEVRLGRTNSTFKWVVFDRYRKKAMKLVGRDAYSYWDGGLGKTAKALLDEGKRDVTDVFNVFRRTRESINDADWKKILEYAKTDADLTRRVYLKTFELLRELAPPGMASETSSIVYGRDGLIPLTMPGSSARVCWHESFLQHPETVDERIPKKDRGWARPPVKAERLGVRSFGGGRFFCVRQGIFSRFISIDMKSAYGNALARLPDPVRLRCVFFDRKKDPQGRPVLYGFEFEKLRGKWGVLVVDGEALHEDGRPNHPALRMHEARYSGRLRYVRGRFREVAASIPEIMLGVASGRLRIDGIREGVVMEEWEPHPVTGEEVQRPRLDPSQSFLRSYMQRMYAIKEDRSKPKPVRDLAKRSIVSPYGKTYETNDDATSLERLGPMPMDDFSERNKIRRTILRLYAEAGPVNLHRHPHSDRIYFGSEDAAPGAKSRAAVARGLYSRRMRAYKGSNNKRAIEAVRAYVEALHVAGEPKARDRALPVRDFVGRRTYHTGYYWSGLVAAQVTGLTSAMLGLMAWAVGGWAGDTDSVHVRIPAGMRAEELGECVRGPDGQVLVEKEGKDKGKPVFQQPDKVPGFGRFFEAMERAGYEATRLVGGKWQGGIPGCDSLGAWAVEFGPSDESVLVMPKCYSHRRRRPCNCGTKTAKHTDDCSIGKPEFKQAKHGLTKTTADVAEALRMREPPTLRAGASDREKREHQKAMRAWEKASRMLRGERKFLADELASPRVAKKLLGGKPLTREEREELADLYVQHEIHEAFKEILEVGHYTFEKASRPTSIRLAIARGEEFERFFRDVRDELHGYRRTPEDRSDSTVEKRGELHPATYEDRSGWIQWRPIGWEESEKRKARAREERAA